MTQQSVPDVLHLGHFPWQGRGKAHDGSVLALPWEISRAQRCWDQGEALPLNSVDPASPLIALL